jgi:predicted amidophosphoribosyltransferase
MPDSRRRREALTLTFMIALYCRRRHGARGALCNECNALLQYSIRRLSRCVFEAQKPTCTKCPVHCYAATQRERIRTVMRYAGWRMLFLHPVLAVAHLFDGFRRASLLVEIHNRRKPS